MTQRRLPRYLREDSQRADSAPVNWVEYRRLVQPFEEAARFLRAGDSAGLPRAVAYLVEQPRFFGSGYLFEELAAAVATGPHAGPMVADIRKVVLVQARLPIRRETRYVVRLAARYWMRRLRLTSWESSAKPRVKSLSVRRGCASPTRGWGSCRPESD